MENFYNPTTVKSNYKLKVIQTIQTSEILDIGTIQEIHEKYHGHWTQTNLSWKHTDLDSHAASRC